MLTDEHLDVSAHSSHLLRSEGDAMLSACGEKVKANLFEVARVLDVLCGEPPSRISRVFVHDPIAAQVVVREEELPAVSDELEPLVRQGDHDDLFVLVAEGVSSSGAKSPLGPIDAAQELVGHAPDGRELSHSRGIVLGLVAPLVESDGVLGKNLVGLDANEPLTNLVDERHTSSFLVKRCYHRLT